jgi:hypothetical protein
VRGPCGPRFFIQLKLQIAAETAAVSCSAAKPCEPEAARAAHLQAGEERRASPAARASAGEA